MSSKKQKRKKNPKTKNRKLGKDYESYQYGPHKIEREGRFVKLSSHWPEGKHEEFMQSLKEQRPIIKKEIDDKIKRLLEIIGEFDPLDLIFSIAIQNCFYDPETYRESAETRQDCYIEYAQSLILSHNNPGFGNHTNDDVITEFNDLITKVYKDIIYYFGFEAADKKGCLTEAELRFTSIMRALFIRGDSFQEHHTDLFRNLFTGHNSFLKENFGFEIQDMIGGIQEITNQILENFDREKKRMQKVMESHEIYKKFYDEKCEDNLSNFLEEFKALPEIKKKLHEIDSLSEGLPDILFEVRSNERLSDNILILLSSKFGENSDFLSSKGANGWPTNDSIIYERPLIRHNEKYYCFIPQLLFRNSINILEEIIKEKHQKYFHENYQKKRGEFLEEKALEYFAKILPGAKVYKQLFYWIEEGKRAETDGLILYDTNLFIIEAKAGSWSTPARRGSLGKIKGDTKKLIDNAYEQALRTKKFIFDNESPEFENQDGSQALLIKDKSKYENIFVVNVTAENLAHLATHLNSLKAFNIIQGKEWPWSVYLNDLRVISEIIEFPSAFLQYLKQRLKANDFPQFSAYDELDFFMYFLYEGLYFEDDELKDVGHFVPTAYTEDLDSYYDFLGGRKSKAQKPRLRISNDYEKIINSIEATGKEGFSKITTTLLSFDSEDQDRILRDFRKLKKEQRKDRTNHTFTIISNIYNLGITFSVGTSHELDFQNNLEFYIKLKMYQTRMEEWMLITYDISKDEKKAFDFFIFSKKWEFGPQMESRIKSFKQQKVSEFARTGKKLTVNMWCPCGSGLKYSDCCGK